MEQALDWCREGDTLIAIRVDRLSCGVADAEMQKLWEQDYIAMYRKSVEAGAEAIARIRHEVWREQCVKTGTFFGGSWGGQMALYYLARPRIESYMASRGFPPPRVTGTRYAENKKKGD